MRMATALWVAMITTMGCSARTISEGTQTGQKPDGGAPASTEAGVAPSGSTTPIPSTAPPMPAPSPTTTASPPPPPAPYAACPDVESGPVSGVEPRHIGAEGLAVLRARVLASRDKFRDYEKAHGNTYDYTRHFDSFTGDSCRDTVKVTSGVVSSVLTASRTAELGPLWSNPAPARKLGRPDTCFPPVTMDQLYEQCLTETLCKDPRENDLYLQIDARGLLVECGYFPHNCADDCFEGFGPLILTADGTDWTKPLPGCCAPDPQPGCCMAYGGAAYGGDAGPNSCNLTCDGMPPPENAGWNINFDDKGCASWSEPAEASFIGCCGCPLPDAG